MTSFSSDEELPRRLERVVTERLARVPVVVLHGPRTVGKSTMLLRLARTTGGQVVDLDDRATRTVAAADPALYTGSPTVTFIDEYQRVPDILDAIKAELNRELRPGRFVVTGSTNYSTIPRAAQSLTGRAEVLTVWPFSQGEIESTQEGFVETLLTDPAQLRGFTSATARDDYAARVLAGGLPVALRQPSDPDRRRWFQVYLDLVVQRDVLDIRSIRQREALPQLLRGLIGQTGQLLNIAKAAERSGLSRAVGADYTQLLEAVFLVRRLPAWGRTLSSRTNTVPKLHVLDSGVGAWLLGLSAARLARRETTALGQFGHLLESFAVHEILKQVQWLPELPTAGHYRTKDGVEVDLVLEQFDGSVSAVEVKAGTQIRAEDLRGLTHLRERLGSAFLGGIVLYTGEVAYQLADRIFAVPLDALWRTPRQPVEDAAVQVGG
ncbi:MAG: ATP-binding protein [Pseudonocardia sp.]